VLVLVASAIAAYTLLQPKMGPGPVEVEVTSDKPSYLPGQSVTFSIYVTNPHDWNVEYPWKKEYTVGNASLIVDMEHGPNPPSFPAHSTTLYDTYVWRPTSHPGLAELGNYTLTVVLDDGSGTCSFEIRPD